VNEVRTGRLAYGFECCQKEGLLTVIQLNKQQVNNNRQTDMRLLQGVY